MHRKRTHHSSDAPWAQEGVKHVRHDIANRMSAVSGCTYVVLRDTISDRVKHIGLYKKMERDRVTGGDGVGWDGQAGWMDGWKKLGDPDQGSRRVLRAVTCDARFTSVGPSQA